MAEYISREAVLKCIENDGYEGEYDLGYYSHNSEFQELIKEIPAADVAEVVRCKDCKYYVKPSRFGYCDRHSAGVRVTQRDYCSWGERKEAK